MAGISLERFPCIPSISPASLAPRYRNLQLRIYASPFSPSSAGCCSFNVGGTHVRAAGGGGNGKKSSRGTGKKDERKKKDNVWSSGARAPEKNVESKQQQKKKNEWNSDSSTKSVESGGSSGKGGGRQNGRGNNVAKADGLDVADLLKYLSPVLPIEDEIVRRKKESIPSPDWVKFCGATSGVWSGVGGAFSPITGELEPISLYEDKQYQYLYDARILNIVATLTPHEGRSDPAVQLHRKVFWAVENNLGKVGLVNTHEEEDVEEANSFLAQEDMNDNELESGYWEDNEDAEDDDDDSEWEYVMEDPEEIDERWENGQEEGLEVMGDLEDDMSFNSKGEIDGTEWKSMSVQTEVLGGDWEEDFSGGESENDFISQGHESSGVYMAESLVLPISVEHSDAEALTNAALGNIWTDLIEEDHMGVGPSIVFFEDGAYSRGPFELLAEESISGRDYFNAYTCKVEQCLVAADGRRLRIVHTISVQGESEMVEVLRVAVYEENRMGPCNLASLSDAQASKLMFFSARTRHAPQDLVGTWKVLEVEAKAVQPPGPQENELLSFLFSSNEILIKRGLPVMPKLLIEEGEPSIDMSDFSMVWLTGGVSTYVLVSETGTLTIGVGWICENGCRLIMERVYGEDGKLLHVISKTESREVD